MLYALDDFYCRVLGTRLDKKQLRRFLKVNKDVLILKGNTVIEKAKKKFSSKDKQ